METAETVINDALQEIYINANEQPIQAIDFQFALRNMNRMMSQFDSDGIALGYTIVDNAADAITIPDGAINGLIKNLALRLANSFDMPVSQNLALDAKEGKDTMRNIAVVPQPMEFPDTLPIGSGNEQDVARTSHFYPGEQDEQFLGEQGGSIGLEDNTNESIDNGN